MTIFYQDFNISLMQSFQKEIIYDTKQCVGFSNETDQDTRTSAMSVGIDGHHSTSTTTASANTSSSTATTNTTTTTTTTTKGSKTMGKRTGKRPGRKPAKIDERAKLERSRQSAKECRARKKLRYQYLEELVLNREKAVYSLRDELEMLKQWCIQLDGGKIPAGLIKVLANQDMAKQRRRAEEMRRAAELQKQQQQQRLQIQRVHQRDLPSTSTVFNISSNSSSSSSSPSPPQDTVLSPRQISYHQQQQQQQQQFSNLKGSATPPPPPPYPGRGSKTFMRFGLTRQMAFDDGATVPPHPPYPQQQQQQQQQQPQTSQSSSFSHPQLSGSQPQPNPQQHALSSSNTSMSLHGASALPYYTQNASTQQPSSSSTLDSFKQLRLNPGYVQQPNTVLPDNINVTMPVSTSAYLDDISDLISKEDRNPTGQFTMASSRTNQYTGISSTHSPISVSRMRSVSNPAGMGYLTSSQQQQQQQQQNIFLGNENQIPYQPRRSASFTNRSFQSIDTDVNTSRKRHVTSDASLPLINESNTPTGTAMKEVGLFSGFPISSLLSDADSDSADENPNISRLFQSSSVSIPTPAQKRTLSDPVIHTIDKKARSLDAEIDSLLPDFALYNEVDPNLMSYNLTTVKCMGSTGTLNTLSAASPFGFAQRNSDSPMTTSSGVTSPAPSCQSGHTGSSPAPQLSSFLECSNSSSTLSSAFMEPDHHDIIPTISTPTTESFLFPTTSTTTNPVVCSETGLSATFLEPIPEWYSYLADLQADSANLSLPSTPITAPSLSLSISNPNLSHGLHSVLQHRHEPMAQTPSISPGVLNVPSILEELSSEESA